MDPSPPEARVADPSTGPGTALVTGAGHRCRGRGPPRRRGLPGRPGRSVQRTGPRRRARPPAGEPRRARRHRGGDRPGGDGDRARRFVDAVPARSPPWTTCGSWSPAGVVGGAPVWDMPGAAWQEVFDVNVTGTYGVIAAAVRGMLLDQPEPRRSDRRATSSAASAGPCPHMATARRPARRCRPGPLGRRRARRPGRHHRRPGSTRTRSCGRRPGGAPPGGVEEFIPHQPIGRLLDPSEIADAVARGSARRVPPAVTGSVVAVDGGMTRSTCGSGRTARCGSSTRPARGSPSRWLSAAAVASHPGR